MEMSIADLVDKFTILTIKLQKINTEQIQIQYNLFENEINKLLSNSIINTDLINKLHDINLQMWNLEDAIGKKIESDIDLITIGKAAIEIRKLNIERVSIKNCISQNIQNAFIEEKKYYAFSK